MKNKQTNEQTNQQKKKKKKKDLRMKQAIDHTHPAAKCRGVECLPSWSLQLSSAWRCARLFVSAARLLLLPPLAAAR